jgi:hypothetical protein
MVANLGLHNGGPGKRRLADEQYYEKATIENEQAQVTKASKEESNEDQEINESNLDSLYIYTSIYIRDGTTCLRTVVKGDRANT